MSSHYDEPLKAIDGRARTVRELLDKAKYAIDFYQREYAWQERQVRELVDDLTGKFLDHYEHGHARHEVERYGHYFLGSVVLSHKRSQRFVVDGQQRLTTLTLLIIHLHNLQAGRPDQVDVRNLIYSEKYGRKSFNIDVPDRAEVMHALLEGKTPDVAGAGESVRNLAARYEDIVGYLPDEVTGPALPFFIDWLLENVHLVAIEAYSDEDAYTIFETMNDRGLSLSLPEMLKGYVLANITHEDDQRAVNTTWKSRMQHLRAIGEEEDVDFFKDWLRARHAQSIRPGKKGAENRDFERIGSEFHRWVRDQREQLGLVDEDGFTRFVKRDLDFYAKRYGEIRRAAGRLTAGWKAIRYNADRGFTFQSQAMLAPLTPDDPPDVVRRKVALVADFLDIWLARRVWNFRTIAYSSVRYTLFQLTKELRERDTAALSEFLRSQLDDQPESFAREPRFRLHMQNYRQVRHILARLTWWVDEQCGIASHFEDLVSEGRGRPFEIEHIWADKYERFTDWYPHPTDFEAERNRIGGLVLLQRGINQSLGDCHLRAEAQRLRSAWGEPARPQPSPAGVPEQPRLRRLSRPHGTSVPALRPFRPRAAAGAPRALHPHRRVGLEPLAPRSGRGEAAGSGPNRPKATRAVGTTVTTLRSGMQRAWHFGRGYSTMRKSGPTSTHASHRASTTVCGRAATAFLGATHASRTRPG